MPDTNAARAAEIVEEWAKARNLAVLFPDLKQTITAALDEAERRGSLDGAQWMFDGVVALCVERGFKDLAADMRSTLLAIPSDQRPAAQPAKGEI